MQTEKPSISLPLDMARMVRRQVEEGSHASNSDVIRDALRIWQERERGRDQRLDAIRAKIDAARRGPVRYTAEGVRQHLIGFCSKRIRTTNCETGACFHEPRQGMRRSVQSSLDICSLASNLELA